MCLVQKCCFLMTYNLLGNQYLFQILYTSITIKNSESVVQSEYFGNLCDEEHAFFFFELRLEYKISCVKLLLLS